MAQTLPFVKISATGNDFILFDHRDTKFKGDEIEFFRAICRRRTGIGADGILLLEKSDRAHFKMRYLNADGHLAEMCGNGARAVAFYAFQSGMAPMQVKFEVGNEILQATISGRFVALQMQNPENIKMTPGILEHSGLEELGYAEVGVPHYVLLAKDVDAVDVEKLGSFYRSHTAFSPKGTNVNFISPNFPGHLKIRTYERGVEEETLACGTGAVTSAYMAKQKLNLEFPITFHTRGGQIEVSMDKGRNRLVLQGEVRILYRGELYQKVFPF